MGMAGWGAGLSAAGQGIGELMQQRKMEQMRLEAEARQKEAIERQLAQQKIENEHQQAQLKLQQEQGARQGQNQALEVLQQYSPDSPLDADAVAGAQKHGLGGMIRTVGKGQTALPSRQYQRTPDLESAFRETNDPGAVEGMYRQQTPAERRLEDTQKETRQSATEKRISDEAFRGRQSELDRENRLEQERLRGENKEDVTRMIQAGKGNQGPSPYYQMAPEYDAQGRPIGVQRFNARTGALEEIPGAKLTKQPPGTLGAQSIGNETALDQLDRLEAAATKARDKMGPVGGRLRSIGQQVPGIEVNKDFAELKAASDSFTNMVIKAITGAQMSEPEAQRIKGQIPLYTDKPEVFAAKAKQTRKNLMDLENRLKNKRPADGKPKTAEELLKLYGG